MTSIVIGIDLGGTMVRAGAIDSTANLLAQSEAPIEARLGAEAGLRRIISLIARVIKDCSSAELYGIGIGATGPVDRKTGAIQNPYTLPTWENVPIVTPLAEHFGVPVTLENDADAAALGEYWAGAGKGVQRLYAVTVGTGIGTAFILHGQIYRGIDGTHPEGGHQIIDPSGPMCYCGAYGCWESLASGPAIASQARARLPDFPTSGLIELAQGDLDRIDARMVAQAALAGDPLAQAVIERAARDFSLGLINVITLFTPEVIVLSGGVMRSIQLFMPAIHSAIDAHNLMVPASQVKILPAQLGYHAGLFGAAYAVLQEGQYDQ
jgi:glucokinase